MDPSDKAPAFGVLRAGILFVILFSVLSAVTLTLTKITTALQYQDQQNAARVAAKDWSQIISSGGVDSHLAVSAVQGIFAAGSVTPLLYPNCSRRLPTTASVVSANQLAPIITAIGGRAMDRDFIRAVAFLPGGVYTRELVYSHMPRYAALLHAAIVRLFEGNDTAGHDVFSKIIGTRRWNDAQIAHMFYGGMMGFGLVPIFTSPIAQITAANRCERFVGFAAASGNVTRLWEKAEQFLIARHPNYDLIVERSVGTPYVDVRNRTDRNTILRDGVAVPTERLVTVKKIHMYLDGGFATFSLKLIATCLLGSAAVSLVTVLAVTIVACVRERIMVQRMEARARHIPRQAPFAIIATEIHHAKTAWRTHPVTMGEALRCVNEGLRSLACDFDVFEARLINDGALFVAQSPAAAMAFGDAAVQWSKSRHWPSSDDLVEPLSLKVAVHWCKDARIRSHARDRFNVDVSGTDVSLGAALRSAAPSTAPLVTGNMCAALNVQFQNHLVSSSSSSNPLASNSMPPLPPGSDCTTPGRLKSGPLSDLLFFPLGATPWRQRTVFGFVALHKKNPVVSSRAQSRSLSFRKPTSVAAAGVSPATPVPLAELNPLPDPSSCLAGVLSTSEVELLKPYWCATTAAASALANAPLAKLPTGDGGDEGLDILLSDAVAFKENYAADWLPARACRWSVAKAMIEAKEGYASQVPSAQQEVALSIGTYFYQAFTLAFSPLEGSEQRAVFRRLQIVFGIPERRFLTHLALRCGAICWQQLYGERTKSKHQSHASTPHADSVLESSGVRRSGAVLQPAF